MDLFCPGHTQSSLRTPPSGAGAGSQDLTLKPLTVVVLTTSSQAYPSLWKLPILINIRFLAVMTPTKFKWLIELQAISGSFFIWRKPWRSLPTPVSESTWALFPFSTCQVLPTGTSLCVRARFLHVSVKVLDMSMLNFNFWNQSLHTSWLSESYSSVARETHTNNCWQPAWWSKVYLKMQMCVRSWCRCFSTATVLVEFHHFHKAH